MKTIKLIIFGIVLSAVLCMTSCGGSEKKEEAADQETAAPDTSESTEAANEPANGYEGNGLKIVISETELNAPYFILGGNITNDNKQERNVTVYPLLVNGEIAVSEGFFETPLPGETVYAETMFDADILRFAGSSAVETVQGYLRITDENYNEITASELVNLYTGSGNAEEEDSINHSAEEIYDKEGVKVSFLGSYIDVTGRKEAVYFASNDTAQTLDIGVDSNRAKIDGEAEGRKLIGWEGNTIPAGKKGLISIYVLDSETYSGADFDTADAEITIHNTAGRNDRIPVHLTLSGDSITATADEAYNPAEQPQTEYAVVRFPETGEGIDAYDIYFYDVNSGLINGVINETKFRKSAGFVKEDLEAMDLESIWPGITAASFVDYLIDEDEESLSFVIVFRDLDDSDNMRSMVDIGYFIMEDPEAALWIDAQTLVNTSVRDGAELVDPVEYEELGLHFQVMELE